ncbi:MAG: DUF455 family protein [Thermoanaerobaculia bacterium]
MELRQFADRVLSSEDLAAKLAPPAEELSDDDPGPAQRLRPARPPELRMADAGTVTVPAIGGMADRGQRARIVHAFANHELQAAELFAWALRAFPAAPADFRRGLAGILQDEQRHTRMYVARLEALGGRFGEQPVSGYFWSKTAAITSPLRFVCTMSLTFENANLDHTVDYAVAARDAGDLKTASVIDQIHRDEIEHVRFGWRWLQRLKDDDESMWEAFRSHLTWPLRPVKAKGRSFHRRGREAAGLDDDFIRRLEESRP